MTKHRARLPWLSASRLNYPVWKDFAHRMPSSKLDIWFSLCQSKQDLQSCRLCKTKRICFLNKYCCQAQELIHHQLSSSCHRSWPLYSFWRYQSSLRDFGCFRLPRPEQGQTLEILGLAFLSWLNRRIFTDWSFHVASQTPGICLVDRTF